MSARIACLIWTEAAAAAMLVGVYGSWAEVGGSGVLGTSGGTRGPVVLTAALVAAAVVLFRRAARSAGAWAALCGAGALAAAAYDRAHVADIIGGGRVVAASAHAGWGLDLAFAGSVALLVGGIAWLLLLTSLPWAWLAPSGD